MTATTRTQSKQANILHVARELFLERGYDAVSLDDIVERVGGSKTTLYSYYGDKEGLFAAIVTKECTDKLTFLRELNLNHLDPEAGLHAVASRLVSLVSDAAGRALYRMMVAEAERFPDLAKAFYAAGPAAVASLLRETIQHWQKEGLLRAGNSETLAIQFIGIILGNFSVKSLLLPPVQCSEKEMKDWVAAGVTLFLEGAQAATDTRAVRSTLPHKSTPASASKAIGAKGTS